MKNIPRLRTLLFDTPKNVMLAYSLFRDPRVPVAPKAVLLGAAGFIVSPFDVPGWIPVVGQLDMLALGVLALNVFIDACPKELVHEHEAAIKRRDSRFHHDLHDFGSKARERATGAANQAFEQWRQRRSSGGSNGAGRGRI